MRALACLVVVAPAVLASGGCTLAKPIVGAVTGPVVVLASVNGCGCSDWQGFVCLLTVGAAVGAACGVVTGIISDVQALSGAASDPYRNWWNPLATNTDD
ncbi:MAG: hypothetical protein ACKVQQ_23565 [Burkholderiales bacterium]